MFESNSCRFGALSSDLQHAMTLPLVSLKSFCTHCNPIPLLAPFITKTASGSDFRSDEDVESDTETSMSLKILNPLDCGGSGA